jgi:hypothetical protein
MITSGYLKGDQSICSRIELQLYEQYHNSTDLTNNLKRLDL